MMVKNVPKNYRMDAITLSYLDAMKDKTKDGHSDLIRQAVAYYANYVLDPEEVRNIQMELLFGNQPNK